MPACVVSGTLVDPSGSPISGASVLFNIQTPILTADPVEGSTTTAADGTWGLSLAQGLSGVFTFSAPQSSITRSIAHRFNVNIPASSTASFSSILVDS